MKKRAQEKKPTKIKQGYLASTFQTTFFSPHHYLFKPGLERLPVDTNFYGTQTYPIKIGIHDYGLYGKPSHILKSLFDDILQQVDCDIVAKKLNEDGKWINGDTIRFAFLNRFSPQSFNEILNIIKINPLVHGISPYVGKIAELSLLIENIAKRCLPAKNLKLSKDKLPLIIKNQITKKSFFGKFKSVTEPKILIKAYTHSAPSLEKNNKFYDTGKMKTNFQAELILAILVYAKTGNLPSKGMITQEDVTDCLNIIRSENNLAVNCVY